MRCLLYVWFMLVIVAPTFSYAEVFRSVVRSGAHDGFSRLVFNIPRQTDWDITVSGQSALVKISEPEITFDTSQVFSRIGKTHLRGLQQGKGSSLELDLACACDVSGFTQDKTFLVIDIRNKPPLDDDEFEKPNLVPNGLYRFPGSAFFELPQAETDSGFEIWDAAIKRRNVSLPPVFNESSVDHSQDVLGNDVTPSNEPMLKAEIDTAQNQLESLLEHALAQGVVQKSEIEPSGELSISKSDLNNADVSNIVGISVIDRDFENGEPLSDARNGRNACLSNMSLDVSRWADDSSFYEQVGQLRSGIYGEFDTARPDRILRLAKTYLHFGFGAEARQVLHLLEIQDDEWLPLNALAHIVDGTEIPENNTFERHRLCSDTGALWSALASGALTDDADHSSVLRAFSQLPGHLRAHLGPKLSNIFLKANDVDGAETVVRATRRFSDDEASDLSLAQANLAEAKNDTDLVSENLVDAVNSANVDSVVALVKLIELHAQSKKPLAPDVVDLVASYALEYRTENIGKEVRRAEVIALGLNGEFDAAFDRLQAIRQQDGRLSEGQALAPLMNVLVERGDDISFVRHSVNSLLADSWPDDTAVVLDVAERLVGLGFSGLGRDLLEKANVQSSQRNRADLLLGETALQLDLPHRAMIDLLGVQSAEADKLRAEAMIESGKYNEASRIFAQLNENDQALRSAWHSGELIESIVETPGKYNDLSSISQRLVPTQYEQPTSAPLANARQLVSSSMSVREGISSLLTKTRSTE